MVLNQANNLPPNSLAARLGAAELLADRFIETGPLSHVIPTKVGTQTTSNTGIETERSALSLRSFSFQTHSHIRPLLGTCLRRDDDNLRYRRSCRVRHGSWNFHRDSMS